MAVKLISAALTLALAMPHAAAWPFAKRAAGPNYFFTFGDSYSQTGFNITGDKPSAANPLGNPPLPGSTASGGLNWIGFMVTEYNSSLTLSYNFAYGGATVDANIVPASVPNILSLVDQVQIFSDNLASQPSYAPWTADDTVVGVWIGVNDLGNSYTQANETTIIPKVIDSYFNQLQILYDAGLRQFVLLSVPPTYKTPVIISEGATAQAQLASAICDYNDLLARQLADFESANTGVTAKVVDTSKAFNTAIDDPQAYGAPNATCYNADGTSCLWWNNYHPGIQIQQLVAAEVADVWASGFFSCSDSAMCT